MQTIRITFKDQVSTLEVQGPVDLNGVKPLPVDGLLTAEVRETDEGEREEVVNKPFAATWLGWHRGQCPAYGRTPEDAVRRLAAGKIA